jgi:tripartite-type tricarboxylate transporter receptor subunit TctC
MIFKLIRRRIPTSGPERASITGVICPAAALILLSASVPAAAADNYPNKPIRIIVPSAPSSGPDVVSRLIGTKLTDAWGEQVVADNRPGAAGNIGTEIASKATPDGYTLLMGSSQQISGPLFFANLPYDLTRDFLPICLIASTPYVLSVHPSVAAASVKELIALAKAKPGTLHYGSSGMGGAPHLAAEMLKAMAGINLVHVPYKSVVYALIDVMGGQIQLAFSVMPAALPMIKQGKLKALGVTSLKRTSLAPELEAIAETVPGYEYIGWYGLVAPVKTPNAIITKLNGEVVKALQSNEIKEKLYAMGAEAIGTSPQEFATFMSGQIKIIGKIIQAAGLHSN